MHRARTRLLTALTLAALLLAAVAPAASADDPVAVAAGLDNPRGVTIGSDGALYVAESGRGGSTEVEVMFEGEAVAGCLGDTGGVTRVDRKGHQTRIASLPSFTEAFDPDGPGGADPTCDPTMIGVAATGPTNVALVGRGTLAVTMGLGGDEEVRDSVDPRFGTLMRVLPNGRSSILADLVAFEQEHDPDGFVPDSNPYGATPINGGAYLVADAGGNDVLRVSANGSIDVVAVFPPLAPVPTPAVSCPTPPFLPPPGTPIPPQAVTTSVAIGPDGAWYVGILTGFPFARDAADVFRIDPATGSVTNFTAALDLSYITGLDFGPDGSLYVVELTQASLLDVELCGDMTPGAVWRIAGGSASKVADVPLPSDVAVDANGSVYVSVFSILPGAGEVWKVN